MNKIEYPIFKSQLQNGYELKKGINEVLKKEFLEKYIKEQTDLFCVGVIAGSIDKSLLDISKESRARIRDRQKDRYEFIDPIGIEFKKRYTFIDLLNTIFINGQTSHDCDLAHHECKSSYDSGEYMCRIIPDYHMIEKLDICFSKALFYTKDKLITIEDCIDVKMKIFNEIQKRFPDSIVEMDSNKDYIMVDWN
jgi:hypothetical protein